MAKYLEIFICILLSFTAVFAHTLRTDNSISGMLHIEPDDDPVALVPTDYYIQFKDKDNKLDLKNCDCEVTIFDSISNMKLYNEKLYLEPYSSSLFELSFNYTLPKKGIYTIEIKGKPINNANFNDFKLDYSLRVDKINIIQQETKISDNLYIPLIISVLVIGTIIVFFIYRKKLK